MRRPVFALVAMSAAVGAFLVGPLGVGHAQAQSTAADPRAAFVAEADRICAQSAVRLEATLATYEKRKIDGFGTKGSRRAAPDAVAKYVQTVAVPELNNQFAALSRLRPPTEDVATFRRALASARAALRVINAKPSRVAYGDPFQDAHQLFRAAGLAVCGSADRPTESNGTKKG